MACRVFVANENEPLTLRQLLDEMGQRWKRIPTRNEMANIVSKSGYFEKCALVKQEYASTHRGEVSLWNMKTEEAYVRGWLNVPFENRPINDPMTEDSLTRYNHAGALVQPKK
ncbi:MAG: hypothetical protein CMA72_08165 [Euryarchaeota archaeon]|nr:hypothetical protein [Euryarchaeota archaeon]|tara:strand:+ start:660 stop:998 length:339 start_codon:yes stop_codon:yes gene_type:complete